MGQLSAITKFLLILLINYPIFVVMLVYDVIGALGPILQEQEILTVESMGWLYTVYSILPPVLVVVAGIMADKWGQELTTVICIVPYLASGLFIWLADGEFNLLLVGRVLAGFGEPLLVLQQRILGLLFSGSWLSLAFAMSNVVGQVGNAVVFLCLPLIGRYNLFLALGVGFFAICGCVISCTLYFLLDRCYKFQEQEGREPTPNTMKLSDIKKFPISYWCLNAINALATCSTFVVMSFGPTFLVDGAGYSIEMAGLIIAIMNLTIILAPFTGWIIDKVGHRCLWWGVCLFGMTFSFIMLAIEWLDPVYWLMTIGVLFTILNSSVNAAIPLVVEEALMGTAYGIVGFLFTVGLLIYPSGFSALRQNTGNWFASHLLFAVANFAAFICCLIIAWGDRSTGIFSRALDSKAGNYQIITEEDIEFTEAASLDSPREHSHAEEKTTSDYEKIPQWTPKASYQHYV